MKLQLNRAPSKNGATIGVLLIDGEQICYTLEDEVREVPGLPVLEWKIPGETAIPRGEYRVRITHSPRFDRRLPLLEGVPGYTGVRIHPGNTAKDTDGCILVGTTAGDAFVGHSRDAFSHVFDMLERAEDEGQEIWITVG